MGKTVSRLCGSSRPDRHTLPDLQNRRQPDNFRRRSLPYGADDDGEIWVPLITIDRNANMKHVTLADKFGEIFVKTSDELKDDMDELECRVCGASDKCAHKNSSKLEQDTLCHECQQRRNTKVEQTKDSLKFSDSANSFDENVGDGTLRNNQTVITDVTELSFSQINEPGAVENVTNNSLRFRNCPSESKLALLTERLHGNSSDTSLSTNESFNINDREDILPIRPPGTGRLPRRNFSDGDLQSFLIGAKETIPTESTSLSGTPKLFKRRQSNGHLPSFDQLKQQKEGSVPGKLSVIAKRFGSGRRKTEVCDSINPDLQPERFTESLKMATRNEVIPMYVSAEGLTPPSSPGKTPKLSMIRKLSTIKENFGRRRSQNPTLEEYVELTGSEIKQYHVSTRFDRRKSENDLHLTSVGTPFIKRKEDGPKSPPEVKSPSIIRKFTRRQSDGNIPSFLRSKQTRSPSVINTLSGRLSLRKSDGHVHATDFKSSKITVDTKLARRLSQKAIDHKHSPTHGNKPSPVKWEDAQLFQKEPLLIKTDDDKKRCWITGLVVLSEDYLLVTDHLNKSLKTVCIWDSLVTFSLPLESEPWAVALVSVDIVAVSLPFAKAVQFVSVREGSLALLPKIKTCGNCYGVASLGDRLCVSTFNPATVQILSFTGIVLQNVAIDALGTPLFRWPENLTATGDAIYVTDVNTDTVTKLTYDGEVIGQYKDNNLILPTGISAIDEQHMFVTSFGNGRIHVITTDLKQVTVFDLRGKSNSIDSVGFCSDSRMIYVRSNSFGTSEVEDYLSVFGLD